MADAWHACTVTRDFTPTTAQDNFLAASAGSIGFCIDVPGPYVQFLTVELGPSHQGWFPRTHLVIGAAAGYTHLINGEPLESEATRRRVRDEAQGVSGTPFVKTMRALLKMFVVRGKELKLIDAKPGIMSSLERMGPVLVKAFIDAVNPQLARIVQNGPPSFDQLWAIASDDVEEVPSNYICLYKGIKHGDRTSAVYGGKTTNARARWSGHRHELDHEKDSNNSMHYRVGRTAAQRRILVLSDFTSVRDHAWHGELQRAGEQAWILLLHMYSFVVLRADESGTPDGGFSSEKSENRFQGQKLIAATLRTSFEDICQITNWPLTAEWAGLNFSSPLSEGAFGNQVVWTRTEFSAYVTYRRSPVIPMTRPRRRGFVITPLHSSYTKKVPRNLGYLPVPEHPTITKTTPLHFSVQISKNGQHRNPFFRAPKHGPFSDWDEVKSMAFRVAWVDNNGTWRSRFIQASNALNLNNRSRRRTGVGSEYNSPSFWLASFYHNTLTRRVYDRENDDIPEYRRSGKNVVLKDVEVDHLAQTISTTDITARTVSTPTILSQDEVEAKVLADHPTIIFGARPDRINGFGMGPRNKCDTCFIMANQGNAFSSTSGTASNACTSVEGRDDQCTRCAIVGRRCTWTHADTLKANPAAYLDLAPEFPSFSVVAMPDPQFTNVIEQAEDSDTDQPSDDSDDDGDIGDGGAAAAADDDDDI